MGFNFLIKNGIVFQYVDNKAAFQKADIAVEDDRIKAVGKLLGAGADRTIDIEGLYVSAGFIDTHAHSEFSLLADGRAEGKISQGITTEINGNCGLSAAPLYGHALERREDELNALGIKERWHTFDEYFSILGKRGIALNFATLAGHNNLRASVAGYSDKDPSKADMSKMTALLKDAIASGAKGLSTGLIYPPGCYSGRAEIIELAKTASARNGIYTSHMRDEGDKLLDAIDEVLDIAKEAKIHAHISHLKTSGEKNWNKLKEVYERIEKSHKSGISVTCDRYPYTASSTDLDALLPSWVYEGGHKEELRRIKNEQVRLKTELSASFPEASSWESVRISSINSDKNKWMEGKSIFNIGKSLQMSPIDTFFHILTKVDLSAGAIFFFMNDENLKSILQRPYTMIGSDSSARSFDGITAAGKPHPRGFGTFPRVLSKFVREEKVLTLSEALYKMTVLPAKTFGIKKRGSIKEGYFADMVVFDPDKVADIADFDDPFKKPDGIYHVFVNGTPVMLDSEFTGAMPGKIMR
ncbi:MAG: D-aminoacylase [Nitrospirae bacterium]|nr:D-aminoacylase [Nitrospirota bacterium]